MVWLAYTVGGMPHGHSDDTRFIVASSSLQAYSTPSITICYCTHEFAFIILHCRKLNVSVSFYFAILCLCYMQCSLWYQAWSVHCTSWTVLSSTVAATVIRGTKTVDHEMSPHWSNWCCTLCSTSSMCRSCSYRWGRPNQNTSRTILQQQLN